MVKLTGHELKRVQFDRYNQTITRWYEGIDEPVRVVEPTLAGYLFDENFIREGIKARPDIKVEVEIARHD